MATSFTAIDWIGSVARVLIRIAMNRWLGASILASVVAVSLAACSDSSGGYYATPAYGGSGYCSQYTSCGTCTPVQGCGWCFTRTSGMCAAHPDDCASLPEFTWAWNPSGCPGADASVASTADAGRTD
jgi:hypothetical protein